MLNTLRASFWRAVARWAYRRWAAAHGPERRGDGRLVKPVGVPGNRDPDHPCESYAPRPRQFGDWDDCLTDGHYLCRECCHRDTERGPESVEPLTWLTVSAVAAPRPAAGAARGEGRANG